MKGSISKLMGVMLLGFWFGFQGHLWSSNTSNSEKKIVVSIMYFDNATADTALTWVKIGIPDNLCSHLSHHKQLSLVERDRMKGQVDEMALGQAGFTKDDQAIKVGQMLGAQYNIYGSVSKAGPNQIKIIGKIVDIQTSEVFIEEVEGDEGNIHSELPKQLAGKLLNRLLRLGETPAIDIKAAPKPEPIVSKPETDFLPGYTQSLAATAHFYRALDFQDNQNWDLARQEYEAAIELDSSFARAYINLGVVYLNLKNYEAAIQNAQHGLQIFPDSELGHYNLGSIYANQGNLDQAIAEFKAALIINSDSPEVLVELGKAYYRKDVYDRAIEAYKQALAVNEKYVSAHYCLGVVYRKQNQKEEALKEWQQVVLTDDPYFKDIKQLAYKQIGDFYLRDSNYELAIANYQKALEISLEGETRGDILLGLGKSFLAKKEPQSAISFLEKALNYLAESPDLHLSYGRALWGIQENDKAIAEFQTTVKLDPEGKFGSSAKEHLKKLQGY